jgi:hypothetical protein
MIADPPADRLLIVISHGTAVCCSVFNCDSTVAARCKCPRLSAPVRVLRHSVQYLRGASRLAL